MNVIKKCLKEIVTNPIPTNKSSPTNNNNNASLPTKSMDSPPDSGWVRPAHVQEKQWYCHNCGKEGHQNSGCDYPITSYGIILCCVSSDRNILEENIEIQEWFEQDLTRHNTIVDTNQIQYLLILDRHTPDYTQIIIGNYEIDSLESIDYLRKLLGRITETEANLILRHNFKDLFLKYWVYAKKDPFKVYHKQFEKANELFNKLSKGISTRAFRNKDYISHRDTDRNRDIDRDRNRDDDAAQITWKSLIAETAPHWFDPDWGFPKGRRKRRLSNEQHETDIECAMREFAEETGIQPEQYRILSDIEPIQEDIKGSNGLNYRNIYYLAEVRSCIPVFVDPSNVLQSSEIGKIGWYTYDQAIKLIRPYHSLRLHILRRIHKYLGSLCPYLK
jgi:8-oxo-dGTP pyrophosphatase MutT (NUDIX family)